jgi:hypothetical protein
VFGMVLLGGIYRPIERASVCVRACEHVSFFFLMIRGASVRVLDACDV